MLFRSARYNRTEPVMKSEFAVALDYIKAVELTSSRGALDLAIKYWEEVVQPFLEKALQKPRAATNSDGSEFASEAPSSQIPTQDAPKKDTIEKLNDDLDRVDSQLANTQEPIKKEILKMARKEIQKRLQKKLDSASFVEQFSEPFKIWPSQRIGFDEMVKELKEKGKEEIAKIEEELGRISRNDTFTKFGWSQMQKNIVNVKPKNKKLVKFNKNIALKLKNTFKKIQGAKHTEIDSAGDEIDVDAYIDFRINRIGDFLKSTKSYPGFDIVIAIDESGSMSNEVSRVRRMCATLYEAISDLPNVRLTIVGWSGGPYCEIKNITKASEIGSLDASGGTPIGTAVWYCKHVIDKFTSTKRLFFLITDGQPNDRIDVDVAQEGVSQMRKKGVICNGICVGPDEANFTAFMKQIFGSEFTVCDDYKHVDVFLTKTISNQIIHSLKMANHN